MKNNENDLNDIIKAIKAHDKKNRYKIVDDKDGLIEIKKPAVYITENGKHILHD